MTSGPDVPLHAPSLLNLAAHAVAKEREKLFDDNLGNHLPVGASHALLDQYRIRWQKEKSDVSNPIRLWCDSSRFPLDYLDLSGVSIDDQTLAAILIAQQKRIRKLDISGVKGISDYVNTILDKDDAVFPGLKSLKMTSMELLSRSIPRRKNGVASMDTRNIPVLGEEDLLNQGGSGRLDQMRETRGTLGIAQQPNQSSYDNSFAPIVAVDEHESMSWTAATALSAEEEEEREPAVFTSRCPNVAILNLPRLKRFPEEEENSVNDLLTRVLEPLKDLQILDLSYWTRVENLRCLHSLNLTTLILYDVPDLYQAMTSINQLKELRYLDISQSSRDTGMYPKPATTLHSLVCNLPYLEKLDISSTNLASPASVNDWISTDENEECIRSDIAGLRFLKKPLKFLGLFNCESASHFAEIPALEISGDANENQVLCALRIYQDRAGLLQSVLNESYQLYRFGNNIPPCRHTEALHLVLSAMQRHLEDSTLQIAGSASLFYIIRKVTMNRETKKQVVSALLSGMETHMEEQVMVRNCCLSLCQFEIPQEILFDYSRLAVLLVTVLQHHNADNLTQRIVVFLLNSMACHVEGDQKVQVGSLGAIEMILEQIRRKLGANTCDDVMEVGWSFLWNITDETPVNCERFLKSEGLVLFQKCFDAFRSERELVRNMMGLIGNIAEVNEFRSQLMKDDYVRIFVALLDLADESLEISYNSAGVLAHMVSDGQDAWEPLSHKRCEVMASIVKATTRWKLDTRRFINYRSFRPILRLLPLWDAYASQHWAVWALANLTTTDGPKYCSYVTNEGGLPLLTDLVKDQRTGDNTRKLARMVLSNIEKNMGSWETVEEGTEAMETLDSV
ncbi:unnamed protein product [Auanema sp. JU1783]|nr:unnamed protein product [Auanema sp. JU1783]